MSLMEIIMALSIVAFALLGTAQVVVGTVECERENEVSTLLEQRCRDLVERLRQSPEAFVAVSGTPVLPQSQLPEDSALSSQVLVPEWDPISRKYDLEAEEWSWARPLLGGSSSGVDPEGLVASRVVPVRIVVTWRRGQRERQITRDLFISKK